MFWVFIISVCFWLLSRFQIFFLAQVHIIVQSYMLTCVMTQGNSGFTGADHSGRWYHVYLNPSLGDSYMLVFKKAPAKITMIFYSILQPSVYVVSVYYFFFCQRDYLLWKNKDLCMPHVGLEFSGSLGINKLSTHWIHSAGVWSCQCFSVRRFSLSIAFKIYM